MMGIRIHNKTNTVSNFNVSLVGKTSIILCLALFGFSCDVNGQNTKNQNINMAVDTQQNIELPTPVKEFVEAVNAGNEEAFLAFFNERTGVINDWGRIFTGHKEIKAWSDKEFIGAKGKMTPQKIEITGNLISLWAGWKSNYYSGDSKFVFVVEGNLIIEMRIESAK